MNLSYWEIKNYLSNIDYTIVGSGIVGLNCELRLRERFPKATIVILKRGFLPQGASTKNAGFACFGSLSEILDDLNTHSEDEVIKLIEKWRKGLSLLRKTLSDKAIDYQQYGGYELFDHHDHEGYEHCMSQMAKVNALLKQQFKTDFFQIKENVFNFQNIRKQLSFTPFEGQIDPGKMMRSLTDLVMKKNISILNSVAVNHFEESGNNVYVKTDTFDFKTNQLLFCTNGFASQLIHAEVKPARAQVVVTKPITALKIKGTFHLDKGFYYFRNIDSRILLGGGRNLDFKTEETTEMGQTVIIQNKLEELLNTTILPNTPFEIEHRWSGIMGVGSTKKPIVKQLSNKVFCGVRLGGMGIAIGSHVGRELANLVN
ncbi:NAD(P)/FAD-dependent oxidoreductase [Gelidibacter maritimus]|uniref:FAD-binding oxidoreductase n=1 Tax=Gelidibacter maritimus TaxID=2761487 RepID=A0A7W2R4J1_9FLAO|nr:FAD-dependent oxidoreductase [Gelidibacter maritimus]MBA6153912.1 FAD-binding oxidoreductase [Gelidibacter maritimus]